MCDTPVFRAARKLAAAMKVAFPSAPNCERNDFPCNRDSGSGLRKSAARQWTQTNLAGSDLRRVAACAAARFESSNGLQGSYLYALVSSLCSNSVGTKMLPWVASNTETPRQLRKHGGDIGD